MRLFKHDTKSPRPHRRRLAVLSATFAVLTVLPITAASASTARPDASPLFTCPSRTACFFDEPNYVGDSAKAYAPSFHSEWISLPFYAESINDNSNSAVKLYSSVTGESRCVAGGRENLPESYKLDEFFIAYNEPNCNGVPNP